MAKFPLPPSIEEIRNKPPEIRALPEGTVLARVYFTGGVQTTRWDQFRHFGPTNARFDHHYADAQGEPHVQPRSIFYCATNATTCFAEVFQDTRRIDRIRNAPWVAIFELQHMLELLDLTGAFTTRVGASMAINTGSRVRGREWAKCFYEAYGELHGIYYASSTHGNAPALAFNDRAEKASVLPAYPMLNRALSDDALLDVLKHSASALGYGLR